MVKIDMEELEKRTQMLQFNERIERESPKCCVYGQHRHNCSKCWAATKLTVKFIFWVVALVQMPIFVLFAANLLITHVEFTIIAVYVVEGIIVLMIIFLKCFKPPDQNIYYLCCDIFCLNKMSRT